MIRLMTDADVLVISTLEAQLFTSASWSLEMIRHELHAPDRSYYVWVGIPPFLSQNQENKAHNQSQILGYAGVWYGNSDAEVMTLGVAPQSQHAGIGRALLSALIQTALQWDARRLLLEVRVDNNRAQRLYQHAGFTPMGIRRHYYQPDDVDALTMSLDLTSYRYHREGK